MSDGREHDCDLPACEGGLSTSSRVRVRFQACRALVDSGVGLRDTDNTPEATGVVMAKMGFKEESEA